MTQALQYLADSLDGDLYADDLMKRLYAVDASVYRQLPFAVAYPKSDQDIKQLIAFCHRKKTTLIPRAAGTSLAGQCVGNGIVVDVSRYYTKIIDFDKSKKTVTVQPGVIRDDLNRYLAPDNLFFGPNTSTANRCMIGGMVGNNSSGTTSITYGVTRDKVKEMHVLLSDGSRAIFGELTKEAFVEKTGLANLEGQIYRAIFERLAKPEVQKELKQHLPKPDIHRRNTGYAVDELLNNQVFSELPEKFNMCKLLAGSEGTLAFTTQITLQLDDLPPKHRALIAAHFRSVEDCLQAVVPAMKHRLFTCEMMDKTILDCTKSNLKYRQHRFFLMDDPQAILLLEMRSDSTESLADAILELISRLTAETAAYALPVLEGEDTEKAIDLRKAGLGLLGNIQSDCKAVACIEDTAVALPDLADYIAEFTALTKQYDQKLVYYAHAGAGELHLRPLLNLKKSEDVKHFRRITTDIAELVKKYKGSFSGEHGDGRVRAEFIETIVGTKNVKLFEAIKALFDSANIFNPGKIVHADPMDESFRYEVDRKEPEIPTLMDFSDTNGILRAAENCNGTGECRKSVASGGTMCPSYRATKHEKDSTRARANALREFLTSSSKPNKFDHQELKEVLELCISCKGCKSECPSNVDMAAYKAEFTYQYQKTHGKSLRSKVFAHNYELNKLGALMPRVTNALFRNKISGGLLKRILDVAPERSLPELAKVNLRKLIKTGELPVKPAGKPIKRVCLFIDEFTDYLDTTVGIDAVELLVELGYEVNVVEHDESGRAHISKGFLEEAQQLADRNVETFKTVISAHMPLLGIEPSAILTFRDEYLRLASDKKSARIIAENAFLIDEFLAEEIRSGHIKAHQFTTAKKTVKIHGHCHQKAMTSLKDTFDILNLPANYKVTIIPSGCCGMAGSFGYEKEHYAVSMAIGEQTLLPAVRRADKQTLISANGTSCRHQIADGAQRKALHPVTILRQALV